MLNIFARPLLIAGLGAALATPFASDTAAQDNFPTRAITMTVPQAPGGTNDIVGRLVSYKMSEILGVSMPVENRAGAGGNIGTSVVAKAPKDGYQLLMTISSSQAINPSLYSNPGFDSVKDFAPIGLVGAVPNVLLVSPDFPAQSVSELIELSKQKPDFYQYASAGNGTLNHLLGEMLNSMAGIKLQHVPYRGVSPALNDVLGGRLPILFSSLPSALPHIQAGKLRALAVSGPSRSPLLPKVPTIAETVTGYNGTLWIGVFAPSGIPETAQATLREAMSKAMATQDLRDKLEKQGVEIAEKTGPEALAALLQEDLAKWKKIVEDSGAKVD